MADNRRIPDWALSKRSRNYPSLSRDNNNNDSSASSSSLTKTAVAAASALAAYAGYELHRSVKKHGWEGTLRLIWEGDPYDPELREAVDQLEDAEFDLLAKHRIDDRLRGLEASLDACTSSSSRETSSDDIFLDKLWNRVWMDHPSNFTEGGGRSNRPLTIERTLADMSDRLDKIAARVDGVILSSTPGDTNLFLARRVKDKKKRLSKAIVSEMERCDALLASYQVLKERKN